MSQKIFLIFIVCVITQFVKSQSLPAYTITVCDKRSECFYFLTPDPASAPEPSCHVILDRTGEVVYYKKFPAGPKTADFKLLRDGSMSYYFRDKFYIMDSSFTIVDSVSWKNGIMKDPHDLQQMPNGNYVLLGVERIKKNLAGFKLFNKNGSPGSDTANIWCGVIQEQDAGKNVVFEWRSSKHFDFMDIDTSYFSDPLNVDWTHMNALEIDWDGNFLVSSRNFNEITKVKRSDGAIMWRLGGKKNQFEFVNDPQKFLAQHDIRRLANGHITLFDNGSPGPPFHKASAKEYMLDEKQLRANLVWSYCHNPVGHSNPGFGNVQRQKNGNTLVNYGKSEHSITVFDVITNKGEKVFEMASKDSLRSYRVFNYLKLPFKLNRPIIISFKKDGKLYLRVKQYHKIYQWSTGDAARTIEVKKAGTYRVFVPIGSGGFISSEPYIIKKAPI
jgi:hypothetical protein